MKILGIETSCDETAAAVVGGENETVECFSNVVSSQIDIHKKFGGVVPEVAAREHVAVVLPVIDEALAQAGVNKRSASKHLDAIAVTIGPGLVTSLKTGIETAKVLSYAWKVPLIGVNHIEGHVYANFIDKTKKGEAVVDKKDNIKFPAIVLTVSGGHTMLILMKGHSSFELLGETRDDAAGEAFDKAAKLMSIGYPGGPAISQRAEKFRVENKDLANDAVKLPRPMIHSDNFDFSFSGLKTAIRYKIEKDSNWKNRINEYCFEFQQAIIDVLIYKTIKAARKFNVETVMMAGGVSANKELRRQLESMVQQELLEVEFSMPDLKYTTDNAAMIASAGYFRLLKKNFTNWRDLKVDCNNEIV